MFFSVWNIVLLFVLGFSPLGKPCKTPVANSAGRPIPVLINLISVSFCYNAIHSLIKLKSAVPIQSETISLLMRIRENVSEIKVQRKLPVLFSRD